MYTYAFISKLDDQRRSKPDAQGPNFKWAINPLSTYSHLSPFIQSGTTSEKAVKKIAKSDGKSKEWVSNGHSKRDASPNPADMLTCTVCGIKPQRTHLQQ